MQNKLPAKTATLVVFIFSLVLEYLPISSSWQDVKVKKKNRHACSNIVSKNVGRCSLFNLAGLILCTCWHPTTSRRVKTCLMMKVNKLTDGIVHNDLYNDNDLYQRLEYKNRKNSQGIEKMYTFTRYVLKDRKKFIKI